MISVVVACYNVEKYVIKAIHSVMDQTFRDLEIICVDDGSTDQTNELLKVLARQDSRIRIIRHEKNQGLLAVRCHGIQAATGEYIAFLDGDDYLLPTAYEKAYFVAEQKRVDVVQFGTELFETDGMTDEHIYELKKYLMPYSGEIENKCGCLVDACFSERRFSWTVWNKIYRTKVMKEAIRFYSEERLVMGEDMLLSFIAFVFAKGYASVDSIGYRYRQGSGVTKVQEHFQLERIKLYAEEYQVYGLLKKWLGELGYLEKYQRALDLIRDTVFSSAYYAYSKCIKEEREQAVECLSQYWPFDDLSIALCAYGAWNNSAFDLADIVWNLRKNESLFVKNNATKVIGMYYYRLYNGGIERVVSLLTALFVNHGYEVVLFTDDLPNSLDYEVPKGVKRVVVPQVREKTCGAIAQRMNAWRKQIKENHVDTLIYHAWIEPDFPYDELAIKATQIPLILYSHGVFSIGMSENCAPWRDITVTQRKSYRLCDVIVSLSEVNQAWWKALGYRAISVTNPATFSSEAIIKSNLLTKNILWIGRISPEKQPIDALKIMRVVHRHIPDAKLLMLGKADNDDYLKRVKAYISEHSMNEYVSLEGFKTNLAEYYQNGTIVLWTSTGEGAPMGMVEAITYGIPVVAYDLPTVDMVRQGMGINVVAQNDYREAAKCIVDLLDDEDKLHELGRIARESADKLLQVDILKQWEDIFELSTKPQEQEKMLSSYPPLETAVNVLMGHLEQCISLQNDVGFGVSTGRITPEVKGALDGLYLDGYYVKMFMTLNKLFPKGSKGRKLLKKIASIVWKG